MLNRADRREWAVLGLMALAWCLVAAPMLHRLTHAHGHRHSHHGPAQPQSNHGDGTFEHQSVTFTAASSTPLVTPVLLAMVVREVAAPRAPELISARRVEQSQAP